MFLKEYIFIVTIYGVEGRKNSGDYDDYFSENFDPTKNCKEEKLIDKLMKEEHNEFPIRCSKVAGKGSDMDNWRQCKKNLIRKLRDMCNWRTILEVNFFIFQS